MDAVIIISDTETLKLLIDLVRRQMLRLLSVEPLTQTQLAKRMALKEPSVSHHLQILLKANLIRIAESKLDSHGILEKYYVTTAKLFIEDWGKMTPEQKRYFIHSNMERLRGTLSAFQLMTKKKGGTIELSSRDVEELAEETAKQIALVAKRYAKSNAEIDREILLIRIYRETLERVMKQSRWKAVFPKPEQGHRVT